MEETSKIMRRSIHIFLQHYHHFTAAAAFFGLPFAVALLLSQSFSSSSSSSSSSTLFLLHTRLRTLFRAAGFPSSFDLFNVLSRKLSQTICTSLFVLPFSLTFLLFSKAYVMRFLAHKLSDSSDYKGFSVYYFSLFKTYICNSFLLLSANASALALFFLAFNLLEGFGLCSKSFLSLLSVSSAVIYSVILANTLVISNLALVSVVADASSSSSSSWGYTAILKACVLIRGRTCTALALALPTNIGYGSVEALFQYRIVKSYLAEDKEISSLVLEGMLIAYLYAILVIIDTIVNFLFYHSCKNDEHMDEEEGYSFKIEIWEREITKSFGSKGYYQER